MTSRFRGLLADPEPRTGTPFRDASEKPRTGPAYPWIEDPTDAELAQFDAICAALLPVGNRTGAKIVEWAANLVNERRTLIGRR